MFKELNESIEKVLKINNTLIFYGYPPYDNFHWFSLKELAKKYHDGNFDFIQFLNDYFDEVHIEYLKELCYDDKIDKGKGLLKTSGGFWDGFKTWLRQMYDIDLYASDKHLEDRYRMYKRKKPVTTDETDEVDALLDII